ncbi:MAG: nucleotidyl transferase AbiEii/AbiGii toxin family protein [Parvularculaceae bacterium]
MTTFAPRLDILPGAQRTLWPELAATPTEFTLYGGTAIALQLSHRQSVDFDFFSITDFDPAELAQRVPYLTGGEVVQLENNTLTMRVRRKDWVLISFFKPPSIRPFAPLLTARDNGLKVAALIDLAGLKAELVQARAAAKDYIDLAALFTSGIRPIEAIAAAQIIHGESYNPWITVKALTSFVDGDLPALDKALRRRLQEAADSVNLHDLPRTVVDLRALYARPA